MKNIKYLMLGLSCVLALVSCEDIIELDLEKEVDKLVVEGWLDDLNDTQVVYLSRNISYTSDEQVEKVSGATVWVTDREGNEYIYSETEGGLYYGPSGFKGEIGNTYQLHIQTKDGEALQSKPVNLLPVAAIDTAFYRASEGGGFFEPGYEILLSIEEPKGPNFYRWKFFVNSDGLLPELMVSDDRFVDGNKIDSLDFPPFIRFDLGDTVIVEQMSLSFEAYKFYETLSQQSRGGGPFDTPPAPVIGNIYNVEDTLDFALGYFGASSVSRKKVIIKEE